MTNVFWTCSRRGALTLTTLLCCGHWSLTSAQAAVSCNPADVTATSASTTLEAALTLDRVVTAAITNHPLIEGARARVEAARGVRRTAGAWTNPVATYWTENGAFPGQTLPGTLQRETSTYVTVPVEPLFQRLPREARADQDVNAAAAALAGSQRQVALEASRAYFRAAAAQASRDAAATNRACLEGLVAYMRARVTEGAAAEGDLIRADVELQRAAIAAVLAEAELARTRAQIASVVGSAGAVTGSIHLPARINVPSPGSNDTFSDLLARARDRRPEISVARAHLAAADASLRVERAITVRQLGGTFGFKQIDGRSTMIAGMAVSLPVFDRNRGGIERTGGERIAALQELAWADRTITADLQAAYDVREHLLGSLAATQGSLIDRAEEARSIALAAYQEGATPLLQVLDATRTVAEAQLTWSRALLEVEETTYELALAAGDDTTAILSAVAPRQASPPATDGRRP
jgi:cobalt-zinc-cadmium efflux system outer membrane protein